MPNIVSPYVQVHVLRMRGECFEHLTMRRSPSEQAFPHLWQVITGGIEVGETAIQAAAREVFEETAISDPRLVPMPDVAMFFDAARDSIYLVPVFAALLLDDPGVVISEEHCEFCWLPLDEHIQRLEFSTHKNYATIAERHWRRFIAEAGPGK